MLIVSRDVAAATCHASVVNGCAAVDGSQSRRISRTPNAATTIPATHSKMPTIIMRYVDTSAASSVRTCWSAHDGHRKRGDPSDALGSISGRDVGGRCTKDLAATLVGCSLRSIDWSGVHVCQEACQCVDRDEYKGNGRHGPREYLRTSNLTHAFSLRQPGPAKGPSKGRENRRGSGPVSGPVSGRSGRVLRG